MKKKNILVLIAVVLALLVILPNLYIKGPWRGKVIDAETKRPIEGAAVVAVWHAELVHPAGAHTYFLDAKEVVTNNKGEFEIPTTWFVSIPFVRDAKGPYFTMFKPGYGSFPQHQVSPQHIPLYLFEGKGAVVELPKAKSTFERTNYLTGPESLDINVPPKKMPKLRALVKEENRFLGYGQ